MDKIQNQILISNAKTVAQLMYTDKKNFNELLNSFELKELFNIYIKNKNLNNFITEIFNQIYIDYDKFNKNGNNLFYKDYWQKSFSNLFEYINIFDKSIKISEYCFTENLFLYKDPYTKNTDRKNEHLYSVIYFYNEYFKYFSTNNIKKDTDLFLKLVEKTNSYVGACFIHSLFDFNFLEKLDFKNEKIKKFLQNENFDKYQLSCIKQEANLYNSFKMNNLKNLQRINYFDNQLKNDFLKNIYLNEFNNNLIDEINIIKEKSLDEYQNSVKLLKLEINKTFKNIYSDMNAFEKIVNNLSKDNNKKLINDLTKNFIHYCQIYSQQLFSKKNIETLNKKGILNETLVNSFLDFSKKFKIKYNKKITLHDITIAGYTKEEQEQFKLYLISHLERKELGKQINVLENKKLIRNKI